MKPVSTPPSRPRVSIASLSLASIIGISVTVALLAIDPRGKKDPASTAGSNRAFSKSSNTTLDPAAKLQRLRRAVDGPEEPESELEFAPLPHFDQEELERMARSSVKDRRRMADLIHRAAAEKDRRFLYLLNQPDLREEPAMDLALAAYDYSVNENWKALDHILEIHARQDPGSDSDSIVTLSYLDEWNRTVEAYHRHFAQGTDGAGGDAMRSFWERRKRLFPHQYHKFRKEGGVEMPDRPR